MADFKQAYQRVLANEGGYSNDPDDPGGETYKGVARKMWSKWPGWVIVDLMKQQRGFPDNLGRDEGLSQMVEDFYRVNFWDKILGDQIENQKVAETVFDFGVNAGISTAVSLAQLTIGAKVDGITGSKTIEALNGCNEEYFLAAYTVAKIARYVSIVKKRPSSRKYFYGWVVRALEG